MPYEDTNRELRIRQRSLSKAIMLLGFQTSYIFSILCLIIGGYLNAGVGVLLGVGFMAVFWYNLQSFTEDTIARRIHLWWSDNPIPAHEIELLKQRTDSDDVAVTDGGER